MRGKIKSLTPLLFLLHCLPFLNRPAIIGGDEPHYALMAHSIAVDGNLAIEDEYREVVAGSRIAGRKRAGRELDRHVFVVAGKERFGHSIGLPLLASPLIAFQQAIAPGAAPDFILVGLTLIVTFVALLAGRDLLRADLVAFGLYFSTPLWYYSRTFFTEPYLWSFAVLGLWFASRQRWIAASVMFALLFPIKETAAIILIPILLAILYVKGWRPAVRAAVFPAIVAFAWIIGNLISPQRFQYGSFSEGSFGLLFDARHGLLPFAPIAIAALIGWVACVRRSLLCSISLMIFAAYFLVVASWVDWRGGSCYGPRLMVPVLPALALPIAHWLRSGEAWRRRFTIVLAAMGFVIQLAAASDPFRAFWGATFLELL